MKTHEKYDRKSLSGRDRRLLTEWRLIEGRFDKDEQIDVEVVRRNPQGLPTEYRVTYKLRSICGVEGCEQECGESYDLRNTLIESGAPMFANRFVMMLTLPPSYPCMDGAPQLRFVDVDSMGESVAMPWHPNIRFYGSFKGRVCLNAMDSFVELVWCIERVAKYLRYELYHSIQEPPYPEDLRVARWLNHNIESIDWNEFI